MRYKTPHQLTNALILFNISPYDSIVTKTMEAQLVSEFLSRAPGANPNDALSCLNSWGWDLKKALIDYNGKCAFN